MTTLFRGLVFVIVGSAIVVARSADAQTPGATPLLNRYISGDYAGVVSALADSTDLGQLLIELKQDGAAWIDAGGAAERNRRELVAATVALEAARAGAWREWKSRGAIQMPCDPRRPKCPPNVKLYWEAPALLLEWGCDLIRQGHQTKAVERNWFLASVAVAERAEDYEFMVGDTTLMAHRDEYEYNGDVYQHIRQVLLRFPAEPRFNLAQAFAEEFHDRLAAERRYEILRRDLDVRGEATMRLGAMAFRRNDDDHALDEFKKVEPLTENPWVLYLARYLTGLVHERHGRSNDAETAYRRALAAVPNAESGAVSLAALLARLGRRDEANGVIDKMLQADPPAADPWRTYGDGDDRFWPQLIAQLRTDIGRT